MKKSLLIISALCLGTFNGFAQLDSIRNANFDQWTSATAPTNWGTAEGKDPGLGPITGSVTQATGSNKLGANTIALNTVNYNGYTIPGLAVSNGSIAIVALNTKISGGFPFRERALALTGMCKYVPTSPTGDSANVRIILTKFYPKIAASGTVTAVAARRDTVGIGYIQILKTTGTGFVSFSVPIDYTRGKHAAVAPDSAVIILESSGQNGRQVGSQFFVDGLGFDYGCTLDPLIKSDTLATGGAVMPPPQLPLATDTLFLTAGAAYSKTYTIYLPKYIKSPLAVTLDSVKLTTAQVTSTILGTTFTVTTNWPANGMIGTNTIACVTISGTVPLTPSNGTGSLIINPLLWGSAPLVNGTASPLAPAATPVKIGKGTCGVTFSQSLTVCAGHSVTVGTNTYNTNGTYTDVITSYQGCDSTITTNLTVLPATTSQTIITCAGSVTIGAHTYTSSGTYMDMFTGVQVNGCDSTVNTDLTLNALPTATPICLVTVDSSSTHNIIIWEKPITTVIDSFAIYREVATNIYSHIASVPYDSLSEYNDYSANPNVTSFKYKMTVLDTCGNESALSDYHNTIHLQTLGNGNFQWTLYEIENQSNPVTYYKLNRDDTGAGNFLPISATIPGTNTTYTDINYASFPNARYYMEAVWNISCTPSRSVSTTRSNIKSLNATGILSPNELKNGIIIYPNPATTKVSITLPEIVGNTNLTIVNVLGETIYNQIITSKTTSINIENFSKGIYTMIVNINGNMAFKKLVVN